VKWLYYAEKMNKVMMPQSKKSCPVTDVAQLLSDRWTIVLVHNLLKGGVFRFCELERALTGISTRTLTLKLKHLEDHGIISKSDEGYTITSLGKQLQPVMQAMEQFGKKL
jgi:DNA-binding HxlR family transcriptional regulator